MRYSNEPSPGRWTKTPDDVAATAGAGAISDSVGRGCGSVVGGSVDEGSVGGAVVAALALHRVSGLVAEELMGGEAFVAKAEEVAEAAPSSQRRRWRYLASLRH